MTFDELGHEEDQTRFIDAKVEEADDRRMVEGLEDSPLSPEASAHHLIREVFRSEHFYSDLATVSMVRRKIDVTHGAASNLRKQLIAADHLGSNPNGFLLAHVRDDDTPLSQSLPN